MGRHGIDLDEYCAELADLFQNGHTAEQLVDHLKVSHGIQVAKQTLLQCFRLWGIKKNSAYVYNNSQLQSDLQARILHLFCNIQLSDKKMLHILRSEDYNISLWTLCWLQTELQLPRRVDAETFAVQRLNIQNQVMEELAAGTVERFEMWMLHTHLQRQGTIISQ